MRLNLFYGTFGLAMLNQVGVLLWSLSFLDSFSYYARQKEYGALHAA